MIRSDLELVGMRGGGLHDGLSVTIDPGGWVELWLRA